MTHKHAQKKLKMVGVEKVLEKMLEFDKSFIFFVLTNILFLQS